ncbi:hypothetical protein ACWEL8_04340 [Streptomyces sp. NPDC004690]|uniref:hypothetical protein n=1 Tax=Streptomyces sp. SID8499 TaxID=2706106 RepID=UPI0013CDA8AF|nr:hypothetical protein [Streptomyces sp. SID8499]NED31913.1 hypothetical protein [Streptomyces sp. SID8499]
MTSYCKAEFQALSTLIRDLGGCAGGMRSAMKQLKDIGPEGSGSDEVESACDDFQDKWGYGIKLIAEAAEGITEKVAESGRLFQHLEDQVAAMTRSVKLGEAAKADDR